MQLNSICHESFLFNICETIKPNFLLSSSLLLLLSLTIVGFLLICTNMDTWASFYCEESKLHEHTDAHLPSLRLTSAAEHVIFPNYTGRYSTFSSHPWQNFICLKPAWNTTWYMFVSSHLVSLSVHLPCFVIFLFILHVVLLFVLIVFPLVALV